MGNNTETPFGTLFLKTLESVLEVVLLSAGGYILAKVSNILLHRSKDALERVTMLTRMSE